MNKKYIEQLKAAARKKSNMLKCSVLSDNELAKSIKTASDGFLLTIEWKSLRKKVIDIYGGKCMCCGKVPKDHWKINVDHIKPRKTHPELALEFDNLQVLCADCNKRKGNKRSTDYRTLAKNKGEARVNPNTQISPLKVQ